MVSVLWILFENDNVNEFIIKKKILFKKAFFSDKSSRFPAFFFKTDLNCIMPASDGLEDSADVSYQISSLSVG